jgi:ABC-type nickel/cobalt efflux system permease component RcnA
MTFLTALGIGVLHTLLGPDHYLPFGVIGRARRWRWGRTIGLTLVCGLGHVLSSVALGLAGALGGAALTRVMGWEEARGEWAGWALVVFGAGYALWGLRRGIRGRAHGHVHLHADGVVHGHGHAHGESAGHPSVHADHGHGAVGEPVPWKTLTPWILFLVFVLGPCEPLIPLFFAAAMTGSWPEVLMVTVGYSAATLAAMVGTVSVFWWGLSAVRLGRLERWSHAAAGGVVLLAGLSMTVLGL